MFSPPVDRSMRQLRRDFFRKHIDLAAAVVFEKHQIGPLKKELLHSRDLSTAPRIVPVRPAPAKEEGPEQAEGRERERISHHWDSRFDKQDAAAVVGDEDLKCVLLNEKIRPDDDSTWSPTLKRLVDDKRVEIRPYRLFLDYPYWSYEQIITSVLPEDMVLEAPVGFQIVGHVAHFNLREEYLPYRHLIAQVLLDKHTNIRTVINKIADVGSHSEFRTFNYELLGGEPDMNVAVKEQNCTFTFDYARVYWNSRLGTEHARLCGLFRANDAVCDVMAGVGPFAIPAARKHVFVWANDLNPHGYDRLVHNARINKVDGFVSAHNMDGKEFIGWATRRLASDAPREAAVAVKKPAAPRTEAEQRTEAPSAPPAASASSSSSSSSRRAKAETKTLVSPRTFDHYVMNLPATAIDFLSSFRGISAGQEALFTPHTPRQLPMVHVYCFSTNSGDDAVEHADICARISERLGFVITPADTSSEERAPRLHTVRLVSPNKQMFCASFRLPAEVVFARE